MVGFELQIPKETIPQANYKNFIHYAVLHKLAESNIPVVRMRSCGSQFQFLIQEFYLDQVYKLWQK